jgi:ribose-phosphate pyrophosphokinase
MRQHQFWSTTEFPYILNLDENFRPFRDGVLLEHKKFDFRGGERHLQILTPITKSDNLSLVITQRFNSSNDIMDIILANDAARRMGFKDIQLLLPYFPAARQDRVCNVGEPLTVRIFADLINSCNFSKVTILCPHSEVVGALLNNVEILDELTYIEQILVDALPGREDTTINIVCPDAGAGKRVGKIAQHLATQWPQNTVNLIRCEKVRDVKDGSLKEFIVQADDLGGYPTLICDDINSMAGTFIGLGNVLRQKNAGKLMLFTTHSDCVEGVQKAIEFFDHVYTTNSKRNYDEYTYTFDNRFTCFDIKI